MCMMALNPQPTIFAPNPSLIAHHYLGAIDMAHNRLMFLTDTARILLREHGTRRAAAFLRDNRVSFEAALWILARAGGR